MYVTVTSPHGRQRVSYASAVAAVAAVLRAGDVAHLATDDTPTVWAVAAHGRIVATTAAVTTLFDPDPAVPAWLERLAAAAARIV